MIYFVGNKLIEDEGSYKLATVEECLEYCNNLDEVAVDTETTGYDCHTDSLLSLQLGDFDRQYVIDCSVINVQKFKPILESKVLLLQNAKFDLRFFYRQNIYPTKVYDTFLAELVLTTGIDRTKRKLGLKDLGLKYANVELDKSIRGQIHREGLSDRVIIYAAEDVKYLHIIKEKQLIEIRNKQLENTLKLENNHIKALAYVEFCGFKLNQQKWLENARITYNRMLEQQSLLARWVIDNKMTKYLDNQIELFSDSFKVTIEWSSPKQMAVFLNDLGIDTKVRDKRTGQMKDSVEAKHIKKFEKQSSFIPLYLKYKELEKQVSTYGEKFLDYINPITGRLHSNFFPIVDTGRISSSDPNLQNIDSSIEVRACFEADNGSTLIVSDYASQEPRVLAVLSNDSKLIEFFVNGDGDIHSLVASNMYSVIEGKPVKVTKADNEKRQIGKILGLKLNYGGSAFTVKDDLGVDIKEAEKFVKAFVDAFPEKEEYYKQGIRFAKNNGYILVNSVTGRRIFLDYYDEWKILRNIQNKSKDEYRRFAILNGMLERQVKNYRIQGSAADQTKYALVLFFKCIREKYPNVKIVSVVHDEIVVECPIEIAETVKNDLQGSMEVAANFICPHERHKFKAEPKITKCWEK